MTSHLRALGFFLFLFVSVAGFAAPGPPGGGGTPSCWPPPCVPIDGGISILIAAGAAYGAKKLYNQRGEKRK